LPTDWNSKTEFRAQIKKAAKFGYADEENFHEAYNKIGNAFKTPGEIPYEIQELFEKSENISEDSKEITFWWKVKALKQYRETKNCFPVT